MAEKSFRNTNVQMFNMNIFLFSFPYAFICIKLKAEAALNYLQTHEHFLIRWRIKCAFYWTPHTTTWLIVVSHIEPTHPTKNGGLWLRYCEQVPLPPSSRVGAVDDWSLFDVLFFSLSLSFRIPFSGRQQFENIKKVFAWHVIDLLKCLTGLLAMLLLLLLERPTRNSIERVILWVGLLSGCLFI